MNLLSAVWRSSSEDNLLQRAAAWLKSEAGAKDCAIFLEGHQEFQLRAQACHAESKLVLESAISLAKEAKEHRAARTEGKLAAIPISGPEEALGAIVFHFSEEVPKTLPLELGTQLFQVYHLVTAAEQRGGETNKLTAVTEVTRTMAQSPYLEEILQLLVHLTAQRFKYKVVTVRLLDEKNQVLILRATQASNKAYQNKGAIHLGESIAGRVLKTGRHAVVQDVQDDPDYVGHDLAVEQGLRSMICLPLMVRSKPVGVLTCYTGDIHTFEQDEVEALEALAKQAALSIEHAKLQVRSTLMQEMHHRVKNNLQQVASLLRLQIRQSHYKDSGQALTDSLARILTIAAVHDLLSRDDLDHVGTRELAETLVHHISQSMIAPGSQIRFSIRGENVFLNTSQATQVALIMNEMIQNAVEHGFTGHTQGEIHLNLEDREGMVGLWVSNNGDPLPKDFNPDEGRLGLQIIQSLARALGGKFSLQNRLGWTVCEVVFKKAGME
jgi:two-component system, sensor histidine kinase PdtaS